MGRKEGGRGGGRGKMWGWGGGDGWLVDDDGMVLWLERGVGKGERGGDGEGGWTGRKSVGEGRERWQQGGSRDGEGRKGNEVGMGRRQRMVDVV